MFSHLTDSICSRPGHMQSIFAAVALVIVLAFAAQRRYLTSIADIPGPLLASISRAWHLWRLIKGDIDRHCIALHEQHGTYGTSICKVVTLSITGPFVRISHDEISVSHPEAIRQILLNPLPKV